MTMLCLLMVFAGCNVYRVLYKQKKYKLTLICTFYLVSIVEILATVVQVS